MKKNFLIIVFLTVALFPSISPAYDGVTEFSLTSAKFTDEEPGFADFTIDTRRLKISHLAPLNEKVNLEIGLRLLNFDADGSGVDLKNFVAGIHFLDNNFQLGFRAVLSTITPDFGPDADFRFYDIDLGLVAANTIFNARVARVEAVDFDDSDTASAIAARHFLSENLLIGGQFTNTDSSKIISILGNLLVAKNFSLSLSYSMIDDDDLPNSDLSELSLGFNLIFDNRSRSVKSSILSGRNLWEPEFFKTSY